MHLMFADDLLLCGEATEKQMTSVMDILCEFCEMSRQEVSKEKSSIIFTKNVGRSLRARLLHISGFKETHDLGKYLGSPLLGRAPNKKAYQFLVDKV